MDYIHVEFSEMGPSVSKPQTLWNKNLEQTDNDLFIFQHRNSKHTCRKMFHEAYIKVRLLTFSNTCPLLVVLEKESIYIVCSPRPAAKTFILE